jgi:hypothetical protein
MSKLFTLSTKAAADIKTICCHMLTCTLRAHWFLFVKYFSFFINLIRKSFENILFHSVASREIVQIFEASGRQYIYRQKNYGDSSESNYYFPAI